MVLRDGLGHEAGEKLLAAICQMKSTLRLRSFCPLEQSAWIKTIAFWYSAWALAQTIALGFCPCSAEIYVSLETSYQEESTGYD